jgi:hypothetical protein
MANAKKTSAKSTNRKPRTERKFPALIFEEALEIAEGIQKYAAGQRVRRVTLFEKLNKEPDSLPARRLVTASGQYGLTKGGYQADFLELTPEGNEATSDMVAPTKKLQTRFGLAIQRHAPFAFLYEKLKGNRIPAKEVLADNLSEANVEESEKLECIEKFTLNAQFLGLLKTIAGSERIIPIEQARRGIKRALNSKRDNKTGNPACDHKRKSAGDSVRFCQDLFLYFTDWSRGF